MTLHPTAEETFGQWVRRNRLEIGLSQEQLAEEADIDMRSIGRIETGCRQPRPPTRRAVEQAIRQHLNENDPSLPSLLLLCRMVLQCHAEMILELRTGPASWLPLVDMATGHLKRAQRDEPSQHRLLHLVQERSG